ncbi:MAG: glycosyltransferase [Flavobacteriaceae bacterium]|jgi:glycosyltransferase involved in cell wall biosynthesis|nr:glycosyltransferase [Flavobacteriaceae bacterium]
MSEEITLSIVVTVYNSGKFLPETLDSIEKVKFDIPHEIILVNDGSTDLETINLLEKLSTTNKYQIFHKENGGEGSAKNAGFANARGKYVLSFDSDDCMYKSYYNDAIHILLKNPEFDILYGDLIYFGTQNSYKKSGRYNRMRLAISGNYAGAQCIYKKEVLDILGGYDESLIMVADWDFNSRAAVHGFKFYYFPKPLFRYRRILDGNSMSQNNPKLYHETKMGIIRNVPRDFFTMENISDYAIQSFKNSPKLLLKAIIIIYIPKLYKLLNKMGILKNKIIVQ